MQLPLHDSSEQTISSRLQIIQQGKLDSSICRKMAQAYTKRNVKIRVKVFFAKTPKKIPILIAIFQRPVIKPPATEMRGPDTPADAYVWPVWCGLSIENKQNRQKFIRNSTFPKLKKSRRPKNLGKSPRGPRSNRFYGSAPKHPQLHGVRGNTLFFATKPIFFSQKTQKVSDFYSPFSQRPMIAG